MSNTTHNTKEDAVKALTIPAQTWSAAVDVADELALVVNTPRRTLRLPLEYVAVALIGLALAALALVSGGHMEALKAANAGGQAIAGVSDFITGITDNLKWLAAAVAAAAIVVIALLFLTGHSRAQDYAIRFGIGCAILAGGTGILA